MTIQSPALEMRGITKSFSGNTVLTDVNLTARAGEALALVGRPEVVFLDELTQNLDPANRRSTWEVVRRVRDSGTTVVLVLHELNLAARYADHLVAMRAGRVVAAGPPAEVVTEQLVRDVFGMDSRVVPDPVAGTPMVVPIGRRRPAAPPTTSPSLTGALR